MPSPFRVLWLSAVVGMLWPYKPGYNATAARPCRGQSAFHMPDRFGAGLVCEFAQAYKFVLALAGQYPRQASPPTFQAEKHQPERA